MHWGLYQNGLSKEKGNVPCPEEGLGGGEKPTKGVYTTGQRRQSGPHECSCHAMLEFVE